VIKQDIRSLDRDQLLKWFVASGEKPFRSRQVYEWLWSKSATSFDKMTNLSLPLRKKLSEAFIINPISLDIKQESMDGTFKSRYTLHDGLAIETVLIPVPEHDRYTVCVSSQVGCSLSCKFCATGQMKRMRNLDAAEIYDQVVMDNKLCEDTFNHRLTNIVYMGMGEPLLNYTETMRSIELITSNDGLGWASKRITLSTAGIAKMIDRLSDNKVKFNLALSLHAANDTKRNEIMPINESNNLDALMDALSKFHQNARGQISYEYIAFKGFNDSRSDAKELIKLCRRFPVKVNIIEYNPIAGVNFEKSLTIDEFASQIRDAGITVTVRRSRGKDIDAACGQLANKN